MRRKGYSLIELVVVLAIMGTLAAIAVPVLSNVTDNSSTGALVSSADGIVKSANSRAQSDPLNPGRGTTINDIVAAAGDEEDVELLAGATSGVRIYGQKDLCINVSITGNASDSVAVSGEPYECLSGSPVTASTTAPSSNNSSTTTVAPTTTTTVAPTTTTTAALTCAQGGTCMVGNTGPGGGIVFYVHPSGTFASPGSDCGSSCKYLEAAPASGEVMRAWATDVNSNRTTAVPAPGATATGIGSGMANTNAIRAQTGNVAATSAAVYAYEYSNNGKSDWHQPSRDELKELCKYARTQTTGDTSVACDSSGSLRADFMPTVYSSSSENDNNGAYVWYHLFAVGAHQGNGAQKQSAYAIRPVRAF